MAQITIEIEELEEILEKRDDRLVDRIKHEVSEEVSVKSVDVLFKCFGLENDEEGRGVLREMVSAAKSSAAFWSDFKVQGKKSIIGLFWKGVVVLIIGVLTFVAIKLGFIKTP